MKSIVRFVAALAICIFPLILLQAKAAFAQQTERANYDLTSKLDATYIPYDYPIGKGDKLRILINTNTTQQPDTDTSANTSSTKQYELMVGKDGSVILPTLGTVKLEGLTVNEATIKLTNDYLTYYKEVYLDVQVLAPARIKVFIRGDFPLPGVYIVYSHTTLFDLLQAVGLSSSGYRRNLVHMRPAEPVDLTRNTHSIPSAGEEEWVKTYIDPLAISVKGDIASDFLLSDGDVLEVEKPAKVVKISGTLRPGIYEVLPGETLADILGLSGSLDVYLDLKNTVVERHDKEGKLERIILDFGPVADGENPPAFALENGDEIKIIEAQSRVYVLGSVTTPGAFAYVPTLTVLDYLAMAGPTDESYLPKTVIIRQPRNIGEPLTENDIIHVDIKKLTKGGTPSADYTVYAGDVILVPDKGNRIDWKEVVNLLNTVFLGFKTLK